MRVLATKTPFPEISPFIGLALVLVRSLQTDRFRLGLPFLVASLIIGIIGDSTLVSLSFSNFSLPKYFWVPQIR